MLRPVQLPLLVDAVPMSDPCHIGERFGRLTVIDDASQEQPYAIECLCECGQTVVTYRYSVFLGHTKSCGCLSQENRSLQGIKNAIDLSGKTFGRLTAIERVTEPGECHIPKWKFRCDCGAIKILGGSYVSRGQIVSCGCAVGDVVRPSRLREVSRRYQANRRKMDLKFALSGRVGNAIRKSLGKTRSKKVAHWELVLGYSAADLMRHLEQTMPLGCSWEDYRAGRLHIDHKRPLASFSFTGADDSGFLEAWSIDNLQLLTSEANMMKHDKWSGA